MRSAPDRERFVVAYGSTRRAHPKMNDIDPQAWLPHVLASIAQHPPAG